MQVVIKIDLSPEFQAELQKLGELPQDALPVGGEAVYEYLRDYHSQMDWKGPRWMPGANSGQFAQDVVNGWQKPSISGSSVVIRNTFGLLDWKVTGGTIGLRRAQWLTIPVIPAARGLTAAEYREATGDVLFKAGRALCHRIGKKIEAVYALTKSVTQFPTKGAMPSNGQIKDVFIGAVLDLVKREAAKAA
jgi:hypothetical protein